MRVRKGEEVCRVATAQDPLERSRSACCRSYSLMWSGRQLNRQRAMPLVPRSDRALLPRARLRSDGRVENPLPTRRRKSSLLVSVVEDILQRHTRMADISMSPTDMVHPDWEAKLEQMKALVARRANRRIVFRQVGDRLIPVGITSSRGGEGSAPTMATTTNLPPNFLSQLAAALDASNNESGSRRRSRGSRRRSTDEMTSLLESLGLGGGSDIEELMVQEAMRISQLEEEERQKKAQAEEGSRSATPAPAAASSSTQVEANPATEQMLSEAMSGTFTSSSHAPSPVHPPAHASTSAPQPASASGPSPLASAPPVLAPIPQLGLDLPSTPTEQVAGLPREAAQVSGPSEAHARPALPGPAASFASTTSATSVSPSQGYAPLPEEETETSPTHASEQSKHTPGQHVELGTTAHPLINI